MVYFPLGFELFQEYADRDNKNYGQFVSFALYTSKGQQMKR